MSGTNTRVAVVVAILALSVVAVAWTGRPEQPRARKAFDQFPASLGDWRGSPDTPMTSEVLKLLSLTDYINRTYARADQSMVGVYVGYWASQRTGETIHSPLNCLPGAGWQPMAHAILDVSDPRGPAGATIPVNRYVIQKGLDRQLVLYWYQAHGRVVASEYWGKFYLVADAMRLNRTDGALVRIIAPVRGDGPDADARAERTAREFMTVLLPSLDGFLPN